jgi:hypothetical protein
MMPISFELSSDQSVGVVMVLPFCHCRRGKVAHCEQAEHNSDSRECAIPVHINLQLTAI